MFAQTNNFVKLRRNTINFIIIFKSVGVYFLLLLLGLNPKLVSEYKWQLLKSELKGTKLELIALNVSLIDVIWPSDLRGIKRSKDAFVLEMEYSGKLLTND